jgi:hypothetical protein
MALTKRTAAALARINALVAPTKGTKPMPTQGTAEPRDVVDPLSLTLELRMGNTRQVKTIGRDTLSTLTLEGWSAVIAARLRDMVRGTPLDEPRAPVGSHVPDYLLARRFRLARARLGRHPHPIGLAPSSPDDSGSVFIRTSDWDLLTDLRRILEGDVV